MLRRAKESTHRGPDVTRQDQELRTGDVVVVTSSVQRCVEIHVNLVDIRALQNQTLQRLDLTFSGSHMQAALQLKPFSFSQHDESVHALTERRLTVQ